MMDDQDCIGKSRGKGEGGGLEGHLTYNDLP